MITCVLRKVLTLFFWLNLIISIIASSVGAQTVKIKMGHSSSPPHIEEIAPYVAVEKGFYKKYGLDVQVIEFRGDAIHTKALLSGEVDLTLNMGATSAIVSASKGAKIRLWIVTNPITPYHFVARKEAGTTIQALVGKSVAVSGIGAISYHIPRMALERSGVDPEKLKYVAVGSPADRFKALLAGKVDATVVTLTETAKLANYPEVIDLLDIPKLLPEIPYDFGVAREDYIQKNPETMYKLAKATLEANRWIAANREGTVEITKKVLPEESTEILRKAYDMADPRLWGVNGDMTEGAYKYTVDFLLKVGYMEKPLPFKQFFDRRFVERGLKELGRK